MSHLTYLEASVVGLIQGVTELFPVSSIGHNVLVPALIGGSWAKDLNVGAPESPYLAFIVGLHVATAIALLIYFWHDWVRIVGGFFRSFRQFARPEPGTKWWQLRDADQKLAWMIVLATIPVGLAGLKYEHEFRVITGHAITAAYFLVANGVILYLTERFRRPASVRADREQSWPEGATAGEPAAAPWPAAAGATEAVPRASTAGGPEAVPRAGTAGAPGVVPGASTAGIPGAEVCTNGPPIAGPPVHTAGAGNGAAMAGAGSGRRPAGRHAAGQQALRHDQEVQAVESDQRLARTGYVKGVLIGCTQILALLAGISRDGVAMAGGMFSGLSRQDAARFSFLLATPVIFAAGALKIGDLLGPLGNGIRGQVLVGSVLSGVGAYLSVRYLIRYFRTRTLTPFAIYCVIVGLGSIIYLSAR